MTPFLVSGHVVCRLILRLLADMTEKVHTISDSQLNQSVILGLQGGKWKTLKILLAIVTPKVTS